MKAADDSLPARRSEQTLSRRYAVLMATIALPLILLVAGLGAYQLNLQWNAQIASLASDTAEAKLVVDGVVKDALDHVSRMRQQLADMLDGKMPSIDSGLRGSLAPSFPAGSAQSDGMTFDGTGTELQARIGNVYLSSDRLPAARPGELEAVLTLFEPMRLDRLVTPSLRWSYYFSASRAFVAIAPFSTRRRMVDDFGHASLGAMIDSYLTYEVFLAATPQRNPGREPYWSSPYLDAAGAGWMVSHASPVYAGNDFVGMVGTDLLLSSLGETLKRLPAAAGETWLVNARGELIAGRSGTPAVGQAPPTLDTALPQLFADEDTSLDAILAPGQHDIAGHRIFAAEIAGTPWTLIRVVSDADLTGIVAMRLGPHAAILAGLLVAILAAFWALRREFVRPAIALVDQLSAGGASEPTRSIPSLWRPWAQLVSRVFSDHRAAIAELAESEQRYRSVVELQTEFVVRMSPDGYLSFVNDAYCRACNMTREQLLDPSWCELDVLPPDERRRFVDHLERLTPEAPDATIELRNVMPDGARRTVVWNDHGIFDKDRRLVEVQSVGRDVSDRVKAERARSQAEQRLAESEAHFRAIAEGVPLPIIIYAIDKTEILFVNEQARQALGLEAGRRGKKARLIWENPSLFDDLVLMIRKEGIVDALEAGMTGRKGAKIDALVSARLISQGGRPAVLVAITDITRQREAEGEINRQREVLYQSEKLSALGSLLAGVAHELNNPLSVVVGYSSMLKEFATDDATIGRAEKIHAAAERCSRIVRTFLAMARKKPPSRGPVQINDVVTGSLEIAAYGLRSAGVEITTDFTEPMPAIRGDVDQLHQVVTNLVVNAQQALLQVEHPRRLRLATSTSADGIEVVVEDNGPGMPETVRERIFEPFYTTKAAGEGTGVGLSVCQGIVAAHDGRISVASEPGHGARFVVWLPKELSAQDLTSDEIAQPAMRAAPARVLVVDDDADIASMIGDMLRGDGHDVAIADDAKAALKAVRKGAFDLLISDIRMPGLDGPGLYRALKKVDARLTSRVLFVTGDTLAPEIDRFIGEIDAPVVEKPLDPQAFRRIVTERLNSMKRART